MTARKPFDTSKAAGAAEPSLFDVSPPPSAPNAPADAVSPAPPGAAPPAPVSESAAGPPTYTVSQLTARIRGVLQMHLPPTLLLVGEISNFLRHTSGHLYFSIKDAGAEIRAVMWKSDARTVKFNPADGLEIVATGSIDVYEPRGQYQFRVSRLEPRGVGAFELAFRQLREKLEREGLFDPARKRPLPRFPQRIGLVTSPTGAAVRDILQTLQRRYPIAEVVLCPARVQGEGAAAQVARAIDRLNAESAALGGIDVLIVGRGGGSLEDLWAFNEESVARAIFSSTIPVVSAVGHEIDVTISDLVADVRAATPTAAAELVVPDQKELLESLAAAEVRLRRSARETLTHAQRAIREIERHEVFRRPAVLLERARQQTDDAHLRLHAALDQRLRALRTRLDAHEQRVARIQPALMIGAAAEHLRRDQQRLSAALAARLRAAQQQIADAARRLERASPRRRTARFEETLAQLRLRLLAAQRQSAAVLAARLDGLAARLEASGHKCVLRRGYSLTRDAASGRILTNAMQAALGQTLTTELRDGCIESRVISTESVESRE